MSDILYFLKKYILGLSFYPIPKSTYFFINFDFNVPKEMYCLNSKIINLDFLSIEFNFKIEGKT